MDRKRPLQALIIEDVEDDVLLITDILDQEGFDVSYRRVDTAPDTREAFVSGTWDVIFADFQLPGFTAIEALKIYNECGLEAPFIIVSGSIGEDIAVEAMRLGAHDYVLKDRLARLPVAVKRELRDAENRRARRAAERERERQAEELAARAEQLYRSNQDLERFAYVAAHDLQEPLRTIKVYSQLLVRRFSGQDSDTDVIVGYIADSVTRMESLIHGLLAYSRITHNPERLVAPVDTNEVLQSVLRQSTEIIASSGAVITCDRLPVAAADTVQLGQIFQNLLSNALKYGKLGEPPRIHFSAERRSNDVLFSVQDNGIGIAAEHYDRIFLIFRRLHRNSEIPGLGVGLAIAKRLVENHGGRIWVESKLHLGSTFYFTLPFRNGSDPA
jgi:signal transduction histidine kinase